MWQSIADKAKARGRRKAPRKEIEVQNDCRRTEEQEYLAR